MSRTKERLLFLLDRLYRFPSGSKAAPDDVNVEGSVQLVHDVSRMAEMGAIVTDPGAAGFFSVDQDNVHAAGGETVDNTVDPYGTLAATWGIPDQRWIWLYRVAGSASSNGTFGATALATLTASVAKLGQAISRRDYLIAAWGAANKAEIGSTLSATFPVSLTSLSTGPFSPAPQMQLPFPLFPGTVLTWHTFATAANPGTIRFEALCWIGPYGVYPPGVR